MKTKVVAAFISLFMLLGASRANAESDFRYGPTVGLDFTTLNFSQDMLTVDRKTGFTAGVIGEKMFPGIGFGVDFGLAYSMRGAKMNLGDFKMWQEMGITGSPSCSLHYLSIPLHVRFKYTRFNGFEDNLAPFIYAGPTLSFLMAHNKLSAMSFSTFELGIDVGIGVEIRRHWQVSAAYSLGMSSAVRAKILSDFNANNQSWSVRCAYLF